MNAMYKNIALILLFVVVSVLVFNLFNPIGPAAMQISFSDFLDKVDKGEVNDVTIKGLDVRGTYTSGKAFTTVLPLHVLLHIGQNADGITGALRGTGAMDEVHADRDAKRPHEIRDEEERALQHAHDQEVLVGIV